MITIQLRRRFQVYISSLQCETGITFDTKHCVFRHTVSKGKPCLAKINAEKPSNHCKKQKSVSWLLHCQNFHHSIIRAYSRHWGVGAFFRVLFLKKWHFNCLYPLSRCNFQPFLMKIFFSKLRALDWVR